MASDGDYFGGIEAGGTKFNCIVATGPDNVLHRARIPTTSPQETLAQVIAFFRSCGVSLRAVGIGSFGPVDPDPRSPTFGYITSTPKLGWRNTDFVGAIRRALNVPVAFDTDVNAAALCVGCGATRSFTIPSARGLAAAA